MTERTLDEETRYRLLRRLEQNPVLPRRSRAREMGVSVSKINYCLRALLDEELVKAGSFRNSGDKPA